MYKQSSAFTLYEAVLLGLTYFIRLEKHQPSFIKSYYVQNDFKTSGFYSNNVSFPILLFFFDNLETAQFYRKTIIIEFVLL